MKHVMIDAAYWVLTIVLTPYILVLTLLGVLFVWCDTVYAKISCAIDALGEWRYNVFGPAK